MEDRAIGAHARCEYRGASLFFCHGCGIVHVEEWLIARPCDPARRKDQPPLVRRHSGPLPPTPAPRAKQITSVYTLGKRGRSGFRIGPESHSPDGEAIWDRVDSEWPRWNL